MPRLPPPRLLALLAVVAALAGLAWRAAPPAAGAWRAPGRGPLVASFRFDPRHPYRAGQRRGATFRVGPGATVRAACAGRVTFAGRLPRVGGTVAQACGALSATYLGLGSLLVRAGRWLEPGAPLGRAGPSGLLGLGARRRDEPAGYIDPLRLLGGPAAPRVPTAPAGPRRWPVPVSPGPAPQPAPIGSPAPRSAPVGSPAPRSAPVGSPAFQPAPVGVPGPRPTRAPATRPAPPPLPAGEWWLPVGLGLLGAAVAVGVARGLSRVAHGRRHPGGHPSSRSAPAHRTQARPR